MMEGQWVYDRVVVIKIFNERLAQGVEKVCYGNRVFWCSLTILLLRWLLVRVQSEIFLCKKAVLICLNDAYGR